MTMYLTAAALEEIVGRASLLAVACDPDDPDTVDQDRIGGKVQTLVTRSNRRRVR